MLCVNWKDLHLKTLHDYRSSWRQCSRCKLPWKMVFIFQNGILISEVWPPSGHPGNFCRRWAAGNRWGEQMWNKKAASYISWLVLQAVLVHLYVKLRSKTRVKRSLIDISERTWKHKLFLAICRFKSKKINFTLYCTSWRALYLSRYSPGRFYNLPSKWVLSTSTSTLMTTIYGSTVLLCVWEDRRLDS